MQEKSPPIWGRSPQATTEIVDMNAATEAQHLIADIAGPQELGARIKSALGYVAELTGISERRVRGMWNGERLVTGDDLRALRRAAKTAQRERDRAEHDAEMAELWAYVARIEERLAVVDAAFTRPHREGFRQGLPEVRRLADGD